MSDNDFSVHLTLPAGHLTIGDEAIDFEGGSFGIQLRATVFGPHDAEAGTFDGYGAVSATLQGTPAELFAFARKLDTAVAQLMFGTEGFDGEIPLDGAAFHPAIVAEAQDLPPHAEGDAAVVEEASECDETCAAHAEDCDGFCDHPRHGSNACLDLGED